MLEPRLLRFSSTCSLFESRNSNGQSEVWIVTKLQFMGIPDPEINSKSAGFP